jgi:aspartate kinase
MGRRNASKTEGLDHVAVETEKIPRVALERERGIIGVTGEKGYYHVASMSGGDEDRATKERATFNALSQAGVSVTMIKYHAHSVSFVLRKQDCEKAEQVIKRLGFATRVEGPMGMLIIHASNMRELTGVMVSASEALMKVGAEIVQLGDSHRTVYILLPESKLDKAVAAMREAFGVGGESA